MHLESEFCVSACDFVCEYKWLCVLFRKMKIIWEKRIPEQIMHLNRKPTNN